MKFHSDLMHCVDYILNFFADNRNYFDVQKYISCP